MTGGPGQARPEVSVTRRVRFSAVRQLASVALDAAANDALFGRDKDLHGHDFTLYVTVSGEVAGETGMVMDLKRLSRLIREEVVARLDRKHLNSVGMLGGSPPTTENLAVAIWERLRGCLPDGALREVELWEGAERSVRYRGGERGRADSTDADRAG